MILKNIQETIIMIFKKLQDIIFIILKNIQEIINMTVKNIYNALRDNLMEPLYKYKEIIINGINDILNLFIKFIAFIFLITLKIMIEINKIIFLAIFNFIIFISRKIIDIHLNLFNNIISGKIIPQLE